MASPTQPQVLDEAWSDDRIRGFLALTPADGTAVDYYRLLRAYQSMRVEDFVRFLAFYREAGHDPNARDVNGKSFLALLNQHRKAGPYVDALKAIGARDD